MGDKSAARVSDAEVDETQNLNKNHVVFAYPYAREQAAPQAGDRAYTCVSPWCT